MNWNPEQYSQLTERYRDMSDAELRRLAAAPDDLTEMANEVLQKEMASRSLMPSAELDDETSDDSGPLPEIEITQEMWQHYAAIASADCTFEFASAEEAYRTGRWLTESGIRHAFLPYERTGFDLRPSRLIVLPRDAERTAVLLSQPVPDHILNAPEEEPPGDFVTPLCPNCGAPDPVLIASDPTNHWLCEACGHEWDDAAEPEPTE